MISVDEYCRKQFGHKLYKISFNANLGCPNRDGTKGVRGCIFCSQGGSGEFAVDITQKENLDSAICEAKEKIRKKYKGDKFIAYFQAYSNTYGPVSYLEDIYFSVIERDDIEVLSIATRPDCLNDDVYNLLERLNEIKPVWIELGLQTIKDSTVSFIRRGYENSEYDMAVKRLREIGIHVITHVILYLPGESEEDMLNTVRHVCDLESDGIKFHLLHVLKGTDLEEENKLCKLEFPTLNEYANTLKKCIDILPSDMVVHRLTGDPPKKLLIEPKWAGDKKNVLNTINNVINPPKPYYVYMLRCEDNSFYTGSSNDVVKRFRDHLNNRGAKYTKSHRPLEVIYVERCFSKSKALSREYEIKQLNRKEKEKLIISADNIASEMFK